VTRPVFSRCKTIAVAIVLFCGLAAPLPAGTFLDKFHTDDLRIVTYNVYRDSIFSRSAEDPTDERFARMVQALQPDVLNLQEIYGHSAQQVADLMGTILPLSDGGQWHTHRASDNVTVSRFPFLSRGGAFGWAEGLVDLPDDVFTDDLYLFNDHFSCCNNEVSRQHSASRMIRRLEDLRTPGGEVDLPSNTPMMVVGDLNIVRSGQPLETLLTGDIIDEELYGPDSPPDWDGTSLANALPLHNGVGPETYTWRHDPEGFDPGVLDFVLYTDSVLTTANVFVLNTRTMSSDDLAATGLQANDVMITVESDQYDHLPVVVDFRLLPEPASLALLVTAVGLVGARRGVARRLLRGRLVR